MRSLEEYTPEKLASRLSGAVVHILVCTWLLDAIFTFRGIPTVFSCFSPVTSLDHVVESAEE